MTTALQDGNSSNAITACVIAQNPDSMGSATALIPGLRLSALH
jgi:hypothetical protein